MKAPISFIFCGLIRNRDLMISSIYNILSITGENFYVSEIILSTWRGELSNYSGLRNDLLSLGISIIESDDPFYIAPGRGNFERQEIAFYNALRQPLTGDHIFRTRPDQPLNNLLVLGEIIDDYMNEYTNRIKSGVIGEGDFFAWVGNCSLRTPFFIQDRFFILSKLSAKKMTSFSEEVRLLCDPGNNIPEIRWFAGAMSGEYEFIKDLLQVDWLAIERHRKDIVDIIDNIPYTSWVYSLYMDVITKHLFVGTDRITESMINNAIFRFLPGEIPERNSDHIINRNNLKSYALELKKAHADKSVDEMVTEFDLATYRYCFGPRIIPPNVYDRKTYGDTYGCYIRLLYITDVYEGTDSHFELRAFIPDTHNNIAKIKIVYYWGGDEESSTFDISLREGRYMGYPKFKVPNRVGLISIVLRLFNTDDILLLEDEFFVNVLEKNGVL